MDGLDLRLYRAPGSKEGDKFVRFRNLPDVSDTLSRNGSLHHAETENNLMRNSRALSKSSLFKD